MEKSAKAEKDVGTPEMHQKPESRPLTEADQLPDAVEEDLFTLPTVVFERRYNVKSPPGQVLIESISAFDLPRVSDEGMARMSNAAADVSSPENVARAFKTVGEYDRFERRAPVNALNRAADALGALGAANRKREGGGRDAALSEAREAIEGLWVALRTGEDVAETVPKKSD